MSTGKVTFAAMSAREIRAGLLAKEFTATEIAQSSFARIAEHDADVHAFLELTQREAFEAAARIDDAISAGQGDALGPLAGVPVAFKDNMHMRGTRTTCGSRMLEGHASPDTAECVQRIIDAGAIPLGKLNLDEFAFGSSTETSAFDCTRNPWDLARVPGGSSGGSVAAVAAGLASLTLGSDAGGSIRQPGAFCGVVAVKPSYGAVPREGIAAFVDTVDQAGPIALCVEDAAAAMTVLTRGTGAWPAGFDFRESAARGVAGMRIGVVPEFLEAPGLSAEVRAAVLAAIDALAARGAQLVETHLPHVDLAMSAYYVIGPRAAYANLANFDPTRFGHCLAGEGGSVPAPDFGAEAKRRILLGAHLTHADAADAYMRAAEQARRLVKQDYERAYRDVDLIVAPVTPRTAFKFGEVTDPHEMHLSDMFTVSVNIAGNAAMSVPVGLGCDSGLPVGVQLIAPAFADENMFRAAGALEEAFGRATIAPTFAPTIAPTFAPTFAN